MSLFTSDPVADAARHYDALDAAGVADELHAEAVSEWKQDARANRDELYRIVRQYASDNGCDHADLLTSVVMGNVEQRSIDSMINAALDYAISCGDGPTYRSAADLEAEACETRAEARRDCRGDQ